MASKQHDILHVCHQGYFSHCQHDLLLYTITCERAAQGVWGLQQHVWGSNSTGIYTLLNFKEFLTAVNHTTWRQVCLTESIIYSFNVV